MKGNWVDFKTVKASVSIAQVLDHYQVNWLRGKGDDVRGRCPIHKGEGQGTFHVNLAKNIFQCFSCHAKGNILDLVAAMEQISVRDAALKLQQWFLPELVGKGEGQRDSAEKESAPAKPEEKPKAAVAINPPLSFQLRVDPGHEYGRSRGLIQETLEYFAAGFCLSKGMFAGRFVVPLHDAGGQLVGYAGRSIDDKEPKYLFPSSEKGFHKKYLLFNHHRIVNEAPDQAVVLVEGFFDCMKVREAGYRAGTEGGRRY